MPLFLHLRPHHASRRPPMCCTQGWPTANLPQRMRNATGRKPSSTGHTSCWTSGKMPLLQRIEQFKIERFQVFGTQKLSSAAKTKWCFVIFCASLPDAIFMLYLIISDCYILMLKHVTWKVIWLYHNQLKGHNQSVVENVFLPRFHTFPNHLGVSISANATSQTLARCHSPPHSRKLKSSWNSGQVGRNWQCEVTIPGWWFQPLWKILVNWDDYPIYGKIKNVPNHQPVYYTLPYYTTCIGSEFMIHSPSATWHTDILWCNVSLANYYRSNMIGIHSCLLQDRVLL